MLNLSRIKIAVIPSSGERGRNSDACGMLRLINPFSTKLIQNNYKIRFVNQTILLAFDIAIVQRDFRKESTYEEVVSILKELKQSKVKVIYDIDDNFLDSHPVKRS